MENISLDNCYTQCKLKSLTAMHKLIHRYIEEIRHKKYREQCSNYTFSVLQSKKKELKGIG